jgi:hypothetical protein
MRALARTVSRVRWGICWDGRAIRLLRVKADLDDGRPASVGARPISQLRLSVWSRQILLGNLVTIGLKKYSGAGKSRL